MSAGGFIAACMGKTDAELQAALRAPEKPAQQHSIPVEWAQFYIREELQRTNRTVGRRK